MFYAYYIFIYGFLFLFGAAIGSFLNVCIYRLPLEESLIKRASHCMSCGEKIRRRDLIPIVSWIFLRGKCHSCGAPISPRYMIVELLNAVLYVLTGMWFGVVEAPIHVMLICLLLSALIVVFFMDWDTQLINNAVVFFIFLLGVAEYFFSDYHLNELTLRNQIIGFFAVSVPLLLIVLLSKERAMGMGDALLMAAGGFFLGWKAALVALFFALISASVVGLFLKYRTGLSKFAFGPFLSLGIAISAFFGNELISAYLSLITVK